MMHISTPMKHAGSASCMLTQQQPQEFLLLLRHARLAAALKALAYACQNQNNSTYTLSASACCAQHLSLQPLVLSSHVQVQRVLFCSCCSQHMSL
jgi:hypothetical protein